jgi:hypothetical protein
MKALSIAAAAVLMLGMVGSSSAQGSQMIPGRGMARTEAAMPSCMPGGPAGMPFGDPALVLALLRSIDLTADQAGRVDAIMEERQAGIAAAMERAGIADPGHDFLSMFTAPELSVRDLSSFLERLDQLKVEIAEIDLATIVDLHDILTQEQLEELAGLGAERCVGSIAGMRPAGLGSCGEDDPGDGCGCCRGTTGMCGGAR